MIKLFKKSYINAHTLFIYFQIFSNKTIYKYNIYRCNVYVIIYPIIHVFICIGSKLPETSHEVVISIELVQLSL